MPRAAQLARQLEATAPVLPASWTDELAFSILCDAIRELDSIGNRLRRLSSEDRLAHEAAVAVGHLFMEPRTVQKLFGPERQRQTIVANGYAISMAWDALDDLRRRWITQRLTSEGLRDDLYETADAYYDRWQELDEEQPDVQTAFEAFRRGAVS